MTRDDLIAFEQEIADSFNRGEIRFPVHLESGNEDALIAIFAEVRPEDWVYVTWRGHLKALLKGVPTADLRAAIRRGESMALYFPSHRVFGSAIVGGTIPIALGTALAIKRAGGAERVWCFVGDMGAETGIAHECMKYAKNFGLPIKWVIENNGVSVCTRTIDAWGDWTEFWSRVDAARCISYHYESKWPHAGAGRRIEF